MVSATLLSVCSVAAKAVPDVLTDAALVLYTAAKPLLDGVYSAQDQESGLVGAVVGQGQGHSGGDDDPGV